ncbi:MAG: SdiA-regulated domain-containing protein, partial [Gammaproteobacteria bacterium]|nr:SdiA-regulated domain-containing protein [Gammaproteobacteria bacterium]
FKISLTGKLKKKKTLIIPDSELEGITLIKNGKYALVIKESNNELIEINIDSRTVTNRKCLMHMSAYDSVADYFSNDVSNKGLEGITWNAKTKTIFAMKEACPGLLMEISSDLQTIINHRVLNADNGFTDKNIAADEIDFSDVCYDSKRDCFWIISDMAKCLFLYDWKENRVLQSLKLAYAHKGKYCEIKKAEGIALNPEKKQLYIVSDETAELFLFDIRN